MTTIIDIVGSGQHSISRNKAAVVLKMSDGRTETSYRLRTTWQRVSYTQLSDGRAQLTLGTLDRANVVITGPKRSITDIREGLT